MEPYRETFREEARELLGELESALLELETSPTDGSVISRIFRALHTLKGSGAMSGFTDLAVVAHEVESVFERVRDGRLAVTRELISLTLAARDQIAALLEKGLDDLPDSAAASGVLLELRKLHAESGAASAGESQSGASSSPRSAEECTYRIRFRPPAEIFRQGINPLGLFRELEQMGNLRLKVDTSSVPALDRLDPESCYLAWDGELTTREGVDAIRDVFIFVEEQSELSIEPLQRERLQEQVAENRGGEEAGDQMIHAGAGGGSTVRVRSGKLDTLVDLIGELVTVQARLSQLAAARDDGDLDAVAEEVERLTWELRDQVLNIRMLPIGTTFSRFGRLVRDLGEELGKDVGLTTEGAETELDKTVLERLSDPLVHLIRNCIGHGIERPVDREAAGKPAQGRIHLAARHSGAHVLLEVSDDGVGIDPGQVRRRAVSLGLVSGETELTDREVYGIIFAPGFSTVTSVNNVSGRGVGMDVVKRAVDELRGSIEILSRPGEGTTFLLKLPLTLAIIDGLLVKVGGDSYIFPLSAVEECIELRRQDADWAHGRNLCSVRGEILPYMRLRERFSIDAPQPEIEQIVVAEADGQRVGFVVDEVVGEHQTVIKALGRMYRDVRGLSGATILGDGKVALILDLSQLLQLEESLACEAWG